MTTKFSDEAVKRVAELKKKYPDVKSAVMPALYVAQEELGYLNQDAVEWVAEQVGMPPVHVKELVTFYTMYYSKPVGKYHFQVCRTLSCALRGSKELMELLHEKFGTLPNEVTADGMWSYEPVECLGSCGTAPMCEINDHFFENLTPQKLSEIIEKIKNEKPDLRLSAKKDALGAGLKGYPKSEVI
jgi:NADH-quinone oxidoreductase E subunit